MQRLLAHLPPLMIAASASLGQVTVTSVRSEIAATTQTDAFTGVTGTDAAAAFQASLVHGVNLPPNTAPPPGAEGAVLFISCHFENAFGVAATLTGAGPASSVPVGTGTTAAVRTDVRFTVATPTPFRLAFKGSGNAAAATQNLRIDLSPSGGHDPSIINDVRGSVTEDVLATGELPPGSYRLRYSAGLVASRDQADADVRLGVVFGPVCLADFNEDGGVDGSDIEPFFEAWEASSVFADVNDDGGVDGSDVAEFFRLWQGGC
jgi:hypothetical protein